MKEVESLIEESKKAIDEDSSEEEVDTRNDDGRD